MERIEDTTSGAIKLDSLNVEIPGIVKPSAQLPPCSIRRLGAIPLVDGMGPVDPDRAQLLLNGTWRPALSTTGVGGLPSLENAGNVLRPGTALQLSIRTPPTVDAEAACAEVKAELERDPPYGARITFDGHGASGWHAPMLRPWLHQASTMPLRAGFSAQRCTWEKVEPFRSWGCLVNCFSSPVPDYRRAWPRFQCAWPK